MQSYTDIQDTETLRDSRQLLLNNDDTARSCHSGASFPTSNLLIGMLCLRTDESKLYQLASIGPDTWILLFDLTKTFLSAEQAAAAYQPLDADLTGLAGVSTNGAVERTGAGTFGTFTVSAAAKSVLDDASTAAMLATLGAAAASHTHTFANISDKGTADKLPASFPAGVANRNVEVNSAGNAYVHGRLITISTATPSGGNDGDVWFKY